MRIAADLLPTVWGSKAKKGLDFRTLESNYLNMHMQPLQITAHLLNGYLPSDADGELHLDGILSSAVFAAHPCTFKMVAVATVAPLPLSPLWRSDDGVILYASSDLMPDIHAKGQEYWHKRYPATHNEWVIPKKINAKTSAGQYKDYRVPMDIRLANNLSAICIGNKDEIERLLSYITHVGKKSSQGFGRVAKWEVKEIAVSVDDVLANRPVPKQSGLKVDGKIRHCTWTSPYWFRGWATECVL